MSDAHSNAEAAPHHHTNYVKIWVILLVLLAFSIAGPAVGSATGLHVITLLSAFGIAFVKAYLVAKNFMHVDVERPIVWYALLGGLAVMVVFFAAVSPDVMNHEGSRWVNVAAKAESERREAIGHFEVEEGHHTPGSDAAAADAAAGEAPAAETH